MLAPFVLTGCSTQAGNQTLGASVLQVFQGGTGRTTVTKGQILVGSSTTGYYTLVASNTLPSSEPLWKAASSTYLTKTGDFKGTWDGIATTSLAITGTLTDTKYCIYTTGVGIVCNTTPTGGGDVSGPASSITNRFASFSDTSGKTLTDSGYGWTSFLLRSASTSLPYTSSSLAKGLVYIGSTAGVATASSSYNLIGMPSAQQTIKWNQWQQASSTVALSSSLSSYLLRSASTTIPGYLSSTLANQNLYVGNALGVAEATTSISSGLVAVSSLSGANNNLTNLIDGVFSPGKISGGYITDIGTGHISVSSGLGMARISNNATTTMRFMSWAGTSSLTMVDNALNYIYVDYNGGSPIVDSTTNLNDINNTSMFAIGIAYRDSSSVETLNDGVFLSNYRARSWRKFAQIGVQRTSGGTISASSTMQFGVAANTLYYSDQEVNNSANWISPSKTMNVYYRDGGTGWTASSSHYIRSSVYDNNSGTPATLTNNRYSVYFVYMCLEGSLYAVMGQGDYTLTQAQQATLPAILPPYLSAFAFPFGKIITLKGATSFTEIQNNVSQNFSLASASNHNELSNLQGGTTNEYYHLTNREYVNWASWYAASTTKKGYADFSNTATGLTYNNTTGVTSLTSGYTIPTTASYRNTKWDSMCAASTSLPYVSNSLTSNYYVIGNGRGTAQATSTMTQKISFTLFASSSQASTGYIGGWRAQGTTTSCILGFAGSVSETWKEVTCQMVGNSRSQDSVRLKLGDNSTWTNTIVVNGTKASTTLSYTLNKYQPICASIGTASGTPTVLSCTMRKDIQIKF